jgi:uncharacterized protein YkwD
MEVGEMRRRSVIALVVTLLFVFVAPVGLPSAGASPENPAADEARFVDLVNAARAKGGLPALAVDDELTMLAREWAQHMADGGCGDDKKICHANPISAGVTAPWLKLGENVGVGPSVDPVMQAFINSPGHYANIMDPAFTRIGVGVVWNGSAMYTTHRFMKVAGEGNNDPAPAPAAPAAAPPPRPAPTTTTTAPPPPPTTTLPPPPPASPSRVAAVLAALHALGL